MANSSKVPCYSIKDMNLVQDIVNIHVDDEDKLPKKCIRGPRNEHRGNKYRSMLTRTFRDNKNMYRDLIQNADTEYS